METREIHLDCQSLGTQDRAQLLALGFYEDHFTASGGGLALPPHHLTWETTGSRAEVIRKQARVLDSTVALAKASPKFVGYVEAEIITPEFHKVLPRREFAEVTMFPLARTQQISTSRNKVGDLHIKIPISALTPRLEEIMERAGIYFVETPKRNRIYTLQFLDHAEGRATFSRITDYFRRCGGATEVTYEVCSLFLRKPEDLETPTVVKPGTLSAHFSRHVTTDF